MATAGAATVTAANPGATPSSALTLTITAATTLTSLSPSSARAGSAAFTLTVNGANFVNGAVVYWNGSARTTTYVSATKLTAVIHASDVATMGTAKVTVANPHTNATSPLTFTITQGAAHLTSLSPSSVQANHYSFTLTVTGTGFVSGSVVEWNGRR